MTTNNTPVTYTTEQRTSSNNGSTWTAWSVLASYTALSESIEVTKESNNTIDYSRKVRKGELLPHQRLVYRQVEHKFVPGVMEYMSRPSSSSALRTHRRQVATYSLATNLAVPNPLVEPTSLLDKTICAPLLQAAAAACSTEGVDGLTFIAELTKVRSMALKASARVLKGLKNGRYDRSLLLDVPGLWLEARFGWRPLISDLMEISKQLERVDRMEQIIVSKSRSCTSGITIPSYKSIAQNAQIKEIFKADYSLEVSYRGSCSALMRSSGFGFNPLATAWELIPFSFVIDWLVSVGSSIMAAQTAFLSQQMSSSYGWKLELTTTRSLTGSLGTGDPKWLVYSNTCGDVTKTTIVERYPIPVAIAPMLHVRIDAFKGIDAYMLLLQQLLNRGFR